MFINNKITQISTLLTKNKNKIVQTQRFAFKLTEKQKKERRFHFS